VAHALKPIVLGPNQPPARPYRGGAGIAAFRGAAKHSTARDGATRPSEFSPEDFVGSTTEVFGGGAGLTRLPDGRTLRDAIERDPLAYLGETHVARFGADPALLVKLLHTGERLFVHFHPDAGFADAHFGLGRGKTEAWVIIATESTADAHAYLGFNRDVDEAEVECWFTTQDAAAMLAAMNRVSVRPGDTLYVPATVPHAIGPGITLLELQEPVDLSILLEYRGFNGLTEQSALLGLDRSTALADLDRHSWDAAQLATLTGSPRASVQGQGAGESVAPLFPQAADAYFRAERISLDAASIRLDPSFAILVVLEGSGTLTTADDGLDVTAGMSVLVPFGAGPAQLAGSLSAVRCMPPS
jgi:mannose-6-phosphate isomerase